MVKGTRKVKKTTRSTSKQILTIPQLRKAFDHMDKVVEHLRKVAKHSFSDAVVSYREEWRKTFKRDLPPADAAAYLKFRYGLKAGKTRRSKTRGGAMAGSSGAPLDYQLRAGVAGTYGNFPSYQSQGLDRYYSSAINEDCGKPSGFPTDGSQAQVGGGFLDGLFRPLIPTAPPSASYAAMMTDPGKGRPLYPSADPVGNAPLRTIPGGKLPPTYTVTPTRTYGSDVYSMSSAPRM